MLVYLITSLETTGIGYPLDDAWIHQTYARNLAESGEWAFLPGQPSAGSTAPLWAALLSIGYFIGTNHFIWTFLLGWLILWGLAVLGAYTFAALVPGHAPWSLWAGAFFALEWHLVWAASSGMETLLFAFVVTLVLAALILKFDEPGKASKRWVVSLGFLIGLSGWIRPEGITLLAPAAATLFFIAEDKRQKRGDLILLLAGFAAVFTLYLVFNWQLAGSIWPNTFHAKQAEYAVLRETPLWLRFGRQAALPLIGAASLLLPGFLLFGYRAVIKREWPRMFSLLWVIGFLGLYAVRLPVTYQHGRYIMPIMPICFLAGLAGTHGWLQLDSATIINRLFSRAWLIATPILLVLFWLLGANAYARDVAVIETEMVVVAKWVAENIPADNLIAAHDIGALGYFAPRPILDLAGLVSPDVIPFIRDEDQLAGYLHGQNAGYLIAFPDWYPGLVQGLEIAFESGGAFAPMLGQENMAVYLWD